jgi:hypothetical protein
MDSTLISSDHSYLTDNAGEYVVATDTTAHTTTIASTNRQAINGAQFGKSQAERKQDNDLKTGEENPE